MCFPVVSETHDQTRDLRSISGWSFSMLQRVKLMHYFTLKKLHTSAKKVSAPHEVGSVTVKHATASLLAYREHVGHLNSRNHLVWTVDFLSVKSKLIWVNQNGKVNEVYKACLDRTKISSDSIVNNSYGVLASISYLHQDINLWNLLPKPSKLSEAGLL